MSVLSRSAFTLRKTCFIPEGHVTVSRATFFAGPRPKWTTLSLPLASPTEPQNILLGSGDGTFADVSQETGIVVPQQETGRPSVTWGTIFGDFNLDSWEDLYIAAGDLNDPSSSTSAVTSTW